MRFKVTVRLSPEIDSTMKGPVPRARGPLAGSFATASGAVPENRWCAMIPILSATRKEALGALSVKRTWSSAGASTLTSRQNWAPGCW